MNMLLGKRWSGFHFHAAMWWWLELSGAAVDRNKSPAQLPLQARMNPQAASIASLVESSHLL
jgi:hypothetical protein